MDIRIVNTLLFLKYICSALPKPMKLQGIDRDEMSIRLKGDGNQNSGMHEISSGNN